MPAWSIEGTRFGDPDKANRILVAFSWTFLSTDPSNGASVDAPFEAAIPSLAASVMTRSFAFLHSTALAMASTAWR